MSSPIEAPHPGARSRRGAAHLAAWPTLLLAAILIVFGVVHARRGEAYGWFGVGAGAGLVLLGIAGIVRRDWTLPLFGGLLVLAFATFLAGVSSGAETYIATGIAALVVVGCAAALTHQLSRVADALERRRGGEDRAARPRGD